MSRRAFGLLGRIVVASASGAIMLVIHAGPALAQGLDPAKVAAAIQTNAQALKTFSWQQRVQLQLKGETKKVTLNQMSYDSQGKLVKTQLSEQPPADDQSSQEPSGRGLRGRAKEKIVEKKTGEFKQMMEGISSLIKSYTELPRDQLQAALKQAAFGPGEGDMQGSVQIKMFGVLQPGDALTLWVDREAMLFRRIVIVSTYDQQPVNATANYAAMPTHEVYMGQAIVNYPSKQVVVEIDNLNYQRNQ